MKGLTLWYFVLYFLFWSCHFLVDCSSSNFSFNSSSSPTKFYRHDQSSALIQFINSLSIDCLLNYKRKTNSWKEGTNCCLWDGVKCDIETGNVIGLDLSSSCLRGTITSNSSLFRFHHLQELNLAYNDFSSSQMAFEFGQFTNLTHLNISHSRFTGKIPLEISHLSKLVSLDLSHNRNLIFEGHVFEKLLGNLTQLRHLVLPSINMSLVAPTSFLNMSSYVTTLTLEFNGLRGKFPENVFRFPYLQKVCLTGTYDLEVNFPKTNWSAPLKSLQVSYPSSLGDGELLDSIGNLRYLEVLDLSFCKLNGSIPASLANLTKLFHLSLSNNDLSGHLPFSVFDLTQIEFLDFSRNKLVGLLPYHVTGLSALRELYLDSNFLYGKIPPWLFTLPSLLYLELSYNNLTGLIDDHFQKVSPLEYVNLQKNQIHGQIPSSFFKLENLTYLDLSSNNLNGIFEPDKLSKLNKLEELYLSNNALLSVSGGSNADYTLPSLISLGLSSCNISEFPDFVRNLEGLTELDLSYNRIRVIDANMFFKLKSLAALILSHNSPLSVSNNSNTSIVLPNLTWLLLSSCNLTEFPNFLIMQESLTYLDLSNNSIQGQISKQGRNWGESLIFLDLSKNFLTGLEYYPWTNIHILNLGSNILEGPLLVPPPSTQAFLISQNNLIGEISPSMCNLVSLQILDLSYNNLSGAVPECLGSGGIRLNLHILDLQMNKFHGNIPDSFVERNTLRTLNLNNNEFDGPLPKSLVNCHHLEVLNLGNNKINDTFPHWLAALQLQVLVLRSNHFHGQIITSENELHFSTLRILDLSHNEFSGFFPTTWFKSFKGMTNLSDVQMRYMADYFDYYQDSIVVTLKGVEIKFERILTIFTVIDLSSNKFQGKIPEIVGNLASLQVLNFSHNKLTGHIPWSLGNLAALESLDLSCNKLVGEIPMQFTGLKFLEVLNLSQNQLVGPIPEGNQFNTFLNDSYGGNLGLCGFPMSESCSYDDPPAPVFNEEADSALGLNRQFVMMGYGCGLVFGFSAGYIMLTIGKPKWLVRMLQRVGYKVLRRLKSYH
ncbi:hypothetical protein REPUB_Repub05bG0078200 [Reevesia pubescens]